jgi:predicted TIM-barrel fold metal-dependent hydrolase
VDPRQKKTYEQAERMLSHPKVLGIKLHPSYHRYRILDFAQELFSFANSQKTVVLIHPPQEITPMLRFANECPDMKLIIAHLGTNDLRGYTDTIAKAEHGNIYTDTSGSASVANNVLEEAVRRVGSKKILFGTDTYSYGFQFGRIALSALSPEDKENILWKNAVSLFPNAFSL